MKKERLAAAYHAHHAMRKREGFVFGGAERADLFARWIGQGHRVLDLGCRDGALSASFCKGNHVVGVDVDPEALDRCRRRLDIEVHWLDLNEPLAFSDNTFDVIVAGEVLEHLFDPAAMVAEASRLLVPGGRFIGSVPNAFRLKNRLLFLLGRDFDGDPTHLHCFSPAGLRDLLAPHFDMEELGAIIGRFVWLSPWLFGNSLVWRATKQVTN